MLSLGIYEKALPKGTSWLEKLTMAKDLGFQFVEMSIDETDERLARLDWTNEEIGQVRQAIHVIRLDHPMNQSVRKPWKSWVKQST